MPKKIQPPESTRRVEDCVFRLADDTCCNANNYLRPHRCNGYCVVKLDQWLRVAHPEMGDEEIHSCVARLTGDAREGFEE